jgi:diacylglycerol kinase (ATP)
VTRGFSFLVNPASGGGAAPGAVLPVAGLLRAAGARVEVTYSPGPEAVAALVQAAVARGDVVVSVGGDGMLSAVVGPVADLDGTLGLVPAGRGNDFARMLGLPEEPAALADLLLHAPGRRVDLLDVQTPQGRRVVAGSVYAGVDARAAALVDAMRRTPRSWQYPLAAVRALATYAPSDYRLVLDGTVHEVRAATVVLANSGCYGNGMRIAPDAQVDDGLLDVIVIEAASKRALIRALPKVYDGSHVQLPEVTVLRGYRAELSVDAVRRTDGQRGTAAPRPVSVGGDGEPLGHLSGDPERPLVVTVQPSALRVLA